MKKAMMVAVLALASMVAFAQVAEFDVEGIEGIEKAFVVDAKSVKGKYSKKYSDYIQVINFTDDTDAVFSLYGYGKKTGWVFLGDSTPQAYGDSENIDSEYNGELGQFTGFAIVPKNNRDYTYTYSKFVINMVVVHHYCSSFKILPTEISLGENAVIFENASVEGSFKDNVKLENYTGKQISVKVYGSDDKENWSLVAGGTAKDEGVGLESVDENTTSKYTYYAVESLDGEKYDFSFRKDHNDLYIVAK